MTLTFEKKYLDLSGFSFNTSSKNRAGHCGNGLFTVCNAAPFASQALKVKAARLNERYGLFTRAAARAPSSGSLVPKTSPTASSFVRGVWDRVRQAKADFQLVLLLPG